MYVESCIKEPKRTGKHHFLNDVFLLSFFDWFNYLDFFWFDCLLTAVCFVFYIYTEDVIRKYKIFTVYVTDPVSNTFTFNFSNLTGLREYAKVVKAESLYDTGVDVSNATQVVTFSTCTDDSKQRVIVSGTYVGESKLDNGTSSEASVSASE